MACVYNGKQRLRNYKNAPKIFAFLAFPPLSPNSGDQNLDLFLAPQQIERVGGCKYKLGRRIGSGSFGQIFLGQYMDTLISFCIGICLYSAQLNRSSCVLFMVLIDLFVNFLWSAATHVVMANLVEGLICK